MKNQLYKIVVDYNEAPRSHFIVINFEPGIIGQISIPMCSERGIL